MLRYDLIFMEMSNAWFAEIFFGDMFIATFPTQISDKREAAWQTETVLGQMFRRLLKFSSPDVWLLDRRLLLDHRVGGVKEEE